MYESCRKHNFSYIVFYIYIYIYIQVFSNLFSNFLLFHQKKQEILQKMMCFAVYFYKSHRICGGFREICVFSCVSIVKRTVFVCIPAKLHHFIAFYSVFTEITLFGNDNGEFMRHLVAGLSTHNRHQREKKFVSRNTPRHPFFHRVFIMPPFFDSNKKF